MEGYDWADDVLGMTITWVRGLHLREIGDLLGFRWDTERQTTFREAEDQHDFGRAAYAVQVGERDGWTVLVEPNGYAVSLPGTVAALSRGGTAVSLFWTVTGDMGFTLARDEVVARRFDPLLVGLDPEGEPLPEEDGLPFGVPTGHLPRAALTLAERVTGVRLDRDWVLEAPRRTWTATGRPHVDA